MGVSLRRNSDGTPTRVNITRAGEDVHCLAFTSKLGMYTKTYIPLCSFDWRSVHPSSKDRLLQVEFDWGGEKTTDDYILQHAGKIHRDWRVDCKKKYWSGKEEADALSHPPPSVQSSDWEKAVQHWGKDETRARAGINAGIRAQGPPRTHVLGRSTIDRMQARHASSHDGAVLSRMEIYERTHSRVQQDGSHSWLDDSYQQAHEQMVSLVHPPTLTDSTSVQQPTLDPEAAFRSVMPPDHDGFVRSVGRSHNKTSWFRPHPQDTDALRAEIAQEVREELRGEMKSMDDKLSQILAMLNPDSCRPPHYPPPGRDYDPGDGGAGSAAAV